MTMTGHQQWDNLRSTLFSKEGSQLFPELEKLSYEELCKRARIALDWLEKNKDHPRYEEAKRKFNWIVYWQGKKIPKDKTPEEIFSYLL